MKPLVPVALGHMRLEGSCHCGAVSFTVEANSPVPFLHCHCSICRKTAGGGGYAINLGARAATMKVRGQNAPRLLSRADARAGPARRAARRPSGASARSAAARSGSGIRRWPELIHPHASAIDTPLPKPPEVVEAALAYAAPWVDVPRGKGHVHHRAVARRVARGLAQAPSSLEPVSARRAGRCAASGRGGAAAEDRACRRAPSSRLRRSPPPGRRSCPSTACRARRPSRRSASNSARSARCGRRCASRSRLDRLRDRHQAAQPAAAAARRPARATAATSPGATPLLLASPLMLTCRQTCSGGSCAGRCSVSRWAIFSRSTRMHPVEVLGDDPRLVALQRADQMPLEPRRGGRRARRSCRAPSCT